MTEEQEQYNADKNRACLCDACNEYWARHHQVEPDRVIVGDALEKARAFTNQRSHPDQVPKPPCDLCKNNKNIALCVKCDDGNNHFEPIDIHEPLDPIDYFKAMLDETTSMQRVVDDKKYRVIKRLKNFVWERVPVKMQDHDTAQTNEELFHDPDAPMVGVKEYLNRAPKNTAQENKPKPSLIPMDICMEYDEPAYQEGLIKYYRESWRKGFPISEMYDAAIRHLEAFFYHLQSYDPDAAKLGIKKHHLAGARFSIACMLQTLRDHPEMDDREEIFGKGTDNG